MCINIYFTPLITLHVNIDFQIILLNKANFKNCWYQFYFTHFYLKVINIKESHTEQYEESKH